jgi:hypothetical protein
LNVTGLALDDQQEVDAAFAVAGEPVTQAFYEAAAVVPPSIRDRTDNVGSVDHK